MTMETNGKSSTMLIALGMILLAAMTRLIPHAPNFTAVTAMALFSGATLQSRWLGVLVPLAALAVTDLLLGSTGGLLSVYLPYAVIAWVAYFVLHAEFDSESQKSFVQKSVKVAITSLGASLFFFLTSNLGVWWQSGMYTRDFQGLMNCYLMALPFLSHQLIGDLFFCSVMFGLFSLAKFSVADSSRAL